MSALSKISSKRFFAYVVASTLVNVVIFYFGQATGVSFDVNAPMPVNPGIVIAVTVAQLFVGYLLALLTNRYAPKLFGALIWVGVAFAIISAPGGWILSSDTATGISLGLMHVSGGLAWFFGIRRT